MMRKSALKVLQWGTVTFFLRRKNNP